MASIKRNKQPKKPEQVEGQLALGDDGVGLTGEAMIAKTDEWIQANYSIWQDMIKLAQKYVSEQRRFSMETLIQFARYDRNATAVSAFKVDNNIRAALSRKLVESYPYMDKYMDRRRSKVDWL